MDQLQEMQDAHRQLGTIQYVRVEDWRGDGGEPNTVHVGIDFDGSFQSFGVLCLDKAGIRAFLAGLCRALGVQDQEALVGRAVYALRAFSTWNEPIVGVESGETGQRFTVRAFCKLMGYPGEDESAYDREVARRESEIRHHERRIAEERDRLAKLAADYVEWG